MKVLTKTTLALAAIVVAGQAGAQVTFYERESFRGRPFATQQSVPNMQREGFNDRASSVIVERGRWEVCEEPRFKGRCVILRRGNYDSLRSIGFEDRISSVRPFRGNRQYAGPAPEPVAQPVYEYRRRPQERVLEVPVTSVRAIAGPPNQRCWMERQQVQSSASTNANVGAAILGGLIGGILGHQVGGGSGRDIATAGGAVAGAAVGSQVGGRNNNGIVSAQDVQRCETVAGEPAYYDVTYNYRGTVHHVQMETPPGATITVNGRGEPRM